ncbi:hypothetical protein GCM10010177_02250 [Actinomadura citrea]|nr:hypothetical protein GCM10010177_02250 [Actinomadura citrea]
MPSWRDGVVRNRGEARHPELVRGGRRGDVVPRDEARDGDEDGDHEADDADEGGGDVVGAEASHGVTSGVPRAAASYGGR